MLCHRTFFSASVYLILYRPHKYTGNSFSRFRKFFLYNWKCSVHFAIFSFLHAHNLKVKSLHDVETLFLVLFLKKIIFHQLFLSDPVSLLCHPVLLLSTHDPVCWLSVHWSSYLSYLIFYFYYHFSLAFLQ